MIEVIIKKFLQREMNEKVLLEKPNPDEGRYVLMEKVGSKKQNHLETASIAFQSYGQTMYEAATLNERLKDAVERLIILDEIRGIQFEGDYNFTDTASKRYRYQAVFEIKHY